MADAAVATGGAPAGAPAAGAAPPASAGATLASVPAGAGIEWASSFKNESLKSFVQERKFTDPEQVVERYQNLEKLRGVPEERLLKLPEKMEGPELRAIYERLGAPKEAKEYGLPRDEKTIDAKFTEYAENMFHEQGLTKQQALGIVNKYNEYAKTQMDAQIAARNNSIKQADEKLKGEWGQAYEKNINIVKQGVKALGLDGKTLDSLEAAQGREALFKTLHKIGVGVGESTFVDGSAAKPADPTAEQAQEQLKALKSDEKFIKKLFKGDVEARQQYDRLNQLAAPGEKQIG